MSDPRRYGVRRDYTHDDSPYVIGKGWDTFLEWVCGIVCGITFLFLAVHVLRLVLR